MSNFTPQQIEEMLREFFDVAGTRQYIGMRYVPMFGRRGESSIDWDDSAPYEPLTIVISQGDSYTSRTYVPEGIPITNQTYWAKTGNYNAQVEAYREDVYRLENQTFPAFVNEVNGDFNDLRTDVNDALSVIGSYPNCVLLGDSWTDINSATVIDGTNWTTYLKWWSFHNFARGGGGLLTGHTYDEQLDDAIADTSYNHAAITHILIIGGINDIRQYQSAANYTLAFRNLCNKAHTNFPHAQIIVIFASTNRPYLDSESFNWLDTTETWENLRRWFITTLPGYSNGSGVSAYNITNIFPESAFITWGDANYQRHLSKAGHAVLAQAIRQIVLDHSVPTTRMLMTNSITGNDSTTVLETLRGSINEYEICLSGSINVPSNVAEYKRVTFDLSSTNDSHFLTVQSTYNFLHTPQSMFTVRPSDETIQQHPIADYARYITALGIPRWGAATYGTSICTLGTAMGINNNTLPSRLCLLSDIPAGTKASHYTFKLRIPLLINGSTYIMETGANIPSYGSM